MSGGRLRLAWLLAFVLLGQWAVGQAKTSREGDRGGQLHESDRDNPQRRQEWFRKGRTVRGETAAALRLRAYRQKLAIRKAAQDAAAASRSLAQPRVQSSAPPPPQVFSVQWTNLGPAPLVSDPSGVQDYGLVSGRVTSVVVDQNDPTGNTVYVGAAYGGLWKSTNAAANPASAVVWTPLTDDQPSLAIGAVGVQPGNSNLILAGTGEATFSGLSYYGVGILRSADGGATWNLISTADNGVRDFKGLAFSHIIFSSDNPNLVVAGANSSPVATDRGLTDSSGLDVYFSLDAGQTFNSATITDSGVTISPSSVTGMVFNPTLHAFFAAIRHHGYYISLDGINWTRLPNQPSSLLGVNSCPANTLFTCPIGRGEITVVPGSATMYTWFVNDNGDSQGMFRSNDGGNTWTSLTIAGITTCGDSFGCGTGGQGDYDLAIAAVPNGVNVDLYAGAVNLFKCSITSTNPTCSNTGSWLNLTHVYGCDPHEGAPAHVHPDQHAIDFALSNPNIIYFGNDGGIYRTLAGSTMTLGSCTAHQPFDSLNGTIGSLTQFIAISTHPTDVSTVLGGTQDNGSPAVDSSHDGINGTTWQSVNLGDGGYNAINPLNGQDWFTANTDVSIQRCQNGITCTTNTFPYVIANSSATSTPNFPDFGSFYNPYILDPANPSRIIIGTCRVWRGNSSGVGFTATSTANALTFNFDTNSNATCTGNENHMVSALAAGGPVTANGSQVIYAGTVDGLIFHTTSASSGATWWNAIGPLNGNFKVSSIAIDPSDPTGQTAYATIMGFGVAHVIKTTSAFQNGYTDITGNLPDAPADSVVVDPIDPSYVYVGTDVGVFVTHDGLTWSEYGVFPNVPVFSMQVFAPPNSNTRKLVVGTHGRGVWQADLASIVSDYVLEITGSTAVYGIAGNTVTVNGTLTSANGYSSPVTISCDGSALPQTCTGGTFTPTPSGTSFSVTMGDPSATTFQLQIKGVGADAASITHAQAITLNMIDFQFSGTTPLNLPRGTPKAFNFNVLPVNFTGSATLSCDTASLPTGITCSVYPSWQLFFTSGQTVSANVNLTATADLQSGDYQVNILVTTVQNGLKTQMLPVTVAMNPRFQLTVDPTLSAKPGDNASVSYTVNAFDGYAGTVNLACNVSAPADTCTPQPPSANTFPATGTMNVSLSPVWLNSATGYASGNDGTNQSSATFGINTLFYGINFPPAMVIQPGTSQPVQFFLYPNNFDGQVAVTCDASAIDPAATCAVTGSPFTLVHYGNSVTVPISLSVPSTVTPGTYPVTIHTADLNSGLTRDVTFQVATSFSLTVWGGPNQVMQTIPGQITNAYTVVLTGAPASSSSVTLSCAGLPAGATCNFAQNPVTVTANQSWINTTVTAGASVAIGDYPFQIVANDGTVSKTIPMTLKVGDFSLSATQPVVPTLPGLGTQVFVQVNSINNFTGTVVFNCPQNLPSGITCYGYQAQAGGTGYLNLSTSPSLSPQTVNLAVSATSILGGATITRTTTVAFAVQGFSLALSPATANIPPTSSANFNLTVAPQNGYNLPLALSCSVNAFPESCSVSPSVISTGQSATVTVTPVPGLTPGNSSQVTVQALAPFQGAMPRTATATVNLVDFQLNGLNGGTLTLGGSTTSNFTVTGVNGFTGPVSVTCSTNSPQAACSVSNPSPALGTSDSLTVSTTTDFTGPLQLAVSASAAGVTHTAMPIYGVAAFHVTPIPFSNTLAPGTSTAVYNLAATSDFGAFSLTWSCPSPPAGLSCAFTPATTTLGSGARANATLTVTAAQSLPAGATPFSIRATSSTLTRTMPAQLVKGSDFLVSSVTRTATVLQGATQDYHILILEENGFSQPVSLACPNLPQGVTCSFSVNPVVPTLAGVDVDVTISATNSAPAGTYSLPLEGTSGSIVHDAAPVPQLVVQSLPDFQVTVQTSEATTGPRGSVSYLITATPLGSFSSGVDFTCVGITEPTISCGPTSLSNIRIFTNTFLGLGTTDATPPGDYPFTLHAVQHNGSIAHDLPLVLHIGDFSVAQPAPQSSGQSSVATYNVSVSAINNYPFQIYLSCGALPTGVGPCMFSPGSVTPNRGMSQVIVSIPVGLNAALGQSSFTITANGTVDHSTTTSLTVLPVQDFTFSSSQSMQPALAGQTLVFPLQLTPLNAFSGTVGLTFTGCPTGAVCSFSPSSSLPISNQTPANTNLSVQLPASAAAVNNNITVTATEPVSGKTHQLTLTAAVGTFNVTSTPTSANVPPGGSATLTANVTGTNFIAPVTIGCSGLAAGMSCVANPPQVLAGQSSAVTVFTTAGVTPPTDTFGITATSLGATRTVSVSLRVVDFTLTSLTSSVSVNAGSSTSVSLRATAQNGFNSSVALSCPPVATGITCSFNPASLVPLSTGSSIFATILTTAATPPGVYTIPLTATGNGATHIVNFTLTVKSFHVAVQPATAITPVGGGRATYSLTLFADQGFTSSVSLSCATPLPTGVTCAFSPAILTPTVAGATSTLTVTVSSSTPQATNTINIRATASPLAVVQPVTLITGADFSLATVTGQQTVQQTQNADFHVNATAIGGMNQPVNLTCSGLPTGASCQFSQNPVTPIAGGQDVDITVVTTLASVPNTYTITVQGVGGGVTHSTTLSLNLQFFPDFVFATPTPLLATRPGQNATYNAQVGKNGVYASIVDLSCAGSLPQGSTCQVQPPSIDFSGIAPGAQVPVSVTVTTAAGTALADSPFTLHGLERGGNRFHDLPLTLRVNDFHLSAPTPLTFAQTDTATYVVTVFADNQFAGPVQLACNNLPPTVGPCNFSTNNFVPSAGGTAVTVTALVGANAAVGQTSFDIVASGGNTSHTDTEPLNIILVQDFTIGSLAPTTQAANPGQIISWPVALTPLNSFSANVALTISGCPTGFTCSFQPPPPIVISNQTQQLVAFIVSVPANAAAANSNITVTGTDPVSGKTHSVVVTVAVQSFSLTISPTSRSVATGAGAMYNVTVNALNGFSQPVLVGCLNPPVGVTCSAPLANPGSTVPLLAMTASNITNGIRTLSIGGALSLQAPPNISVHNVTLSVSSFTPSYTVTTTTPTVMAPVGASASFPLSVRATSLSFISPVTFSCLGNQFTCVFSPSSITPSTTARPVTLTATPTSPLNPGSYPLTVQALAGNQVRQLALTVNVADFAVTTNSSPQTILNPNGGTATYTITLQTSSSFNALLTLSCPGNPAGVTCAFVPASLAPTAAGANSTLTVTTTASSIKGQLNLTVQASGSGLTHQLPIVLVNGQDFQLTATPGTISVAQGGNNSTSIGVTPIGPFSDSVNMSCVAVNPTPAAGSLTCTPVTIAPNNSAPLQVNASPDLPGGVYTLTVQGADGNQTHTIPLLVSVPDFSLGLALAPGITDVLVGASTPISGSSNAIAGYSGSAALSCNVTPPLSCLNLPPSVAPPSPFSFGVNVPSGTTPGPYVLQVTGNDGAGHVHTVTLNLAVRDFVVSLNTGSATIEAGSSTTATGTVTAPNGLAGAVQMSCPPDPNISCAFTPATVTATPAGAPFSVIISAAPVTPPNPYTVQVAGTSSGQQRTAPFALTVTPTNDFNISFAQPAQTINAGEGTVFGFQATAINAFNANVTMTCSGMPAGMSCIPPAPFAVPPGGNFNVAVQTTLGVIQPGVYNLTLSSSGGGKSHSQAISVTVRDFSLSVSPGSQQVLPGTTGDYSVSVSSTSGFSNDVLLACAIAGSPAGTGCSFDQNDLLPGNSTTMHVTSTAGVTPSATYAINVTATSNLTSHSAAPQITISGGDFTLTGNTDIDVMIGTSSLFPLTITAVNGFNSAVSFTCTGGGSGVTCQPPASLTPSPAGTTGSFRVTAMPSALDNSYRFTITATGGGKTHQFVFNANVF